MAFTYVLALIGPRATHIHGYGLISSDPIESPLPAFGAHADHARENLAFYHLPYSVMMTRDQLVVEPAYEFHACNL